MAWTPQDGGHYFFRSETFSHICLNSYYFFSRFVLLYNIFKYSLELLLYHIYK
jgi:hypothetical protein